MTFVLSWLDASEEQQRRIREIVRMFEEPGTRDELGIGQIRDAFSDLLFPGTTSVQTRARYFVFVPWHFVEAARTKHGAELLQRVDNSQRRFITRFKEEYAERGLIGVRAGERVKILPSTIYWGGLVRLGILTDDLNPTQVAAFRGAPEASESDELAERSIAVWHHGLPPVPKGFPDSVDGGFDLTHNEADWLKTRILSAAPDSLFAYLVDGSDIVGTDFVWDEPAVETASEVLRDVVKLAELFSLVMHGPALIYNLLVARVYERSLYTRVTDPVSRYTAGIEVWADELGSAASELRGRWSDLRLTVASSGHRVSDAAWQFVDRWLEFAVQPDQAAVATSQEANDFVLARVRHLRGSRSVLANDRLLADWGGASGAAPLDYRWSATARQMVTDIQEGLARVGA